MQGGGGRLGQSSPLKPTKLILVAMIFLQFGKQHSRYKVILSSIVLSQQCCERYFIPLAVAKPLSDLTTEVYWNRPSLTLFVGSDPASMSVVTQLRVRLDTWVCKTP